MPGVESLPRWEVIRRGVSETLLGSVERKRKHSLLSLAQLWFVVGHKLCFCACCVALLVWLACFACRACACLRFRLANLDPRTCMSSYLLSSIHALSLSSLRLIPFCYRIIRFEFCSGPTGQ